MNALTRFHNQHAAFPEVARALRARSAEIHSRSPGMPESVDLDAFLLALAEQLSSSGPVAFATPRPNESSARKLLDAYHQLRQAVLDEVAAELRRDLRTDETDALNARFDAMMNEHVAATVEQQAADLRALAEAQGQYMSYLSHDLRGSLNGVILMLEVMRRELTAKGEPPETIDDILLMRRSILDAVAMMERHLQLDRLRRGRITPRRAPVNLKPVVDQVIAEASARADQKKVALEAGVPENAAVEGDADLIRQALLELVINAIRHGGGVVRIEAVRREDEWTIAVSDQGLGMEEDRLRQWLDPVRRMQLKDRGVGLQIAYQAARAMHGRLEGEGRPGQGLIMRLVLPEAIYLR